MTNLLLVRRDLDAPPAASAAASAASEPQPPPQPEPQPPNVMWSAPNSVAWGARFVLGPDATSATATTTTAAESVARNSSTSSTSTPPSGGGGNESSTLFIAVIVALIVAFYLLCTYQCLRIWLCRKFFGREVDVRGRALSASLHRGNRADGEGDDAGPDATVLVHEGRVFNLSGDQRRQVLEVIFSEASKPATDMDVAKLKKKRRRRHNGGIPGVDIWDDGDDDDLEAGGRDDSDDDDNGGGRRGGVPLDVQIPGIATAQTEDTSTDDGTASPASSSPAAVEAEAEAEAEGEAEAAAAEAEAEAGEAPSPTDPRGRGHDSDGDDSITSHGEMMAEGAGDDEYGTSSSLSVSDPPGPLKRESSGSADSTSRGSESPSTPERNEEPEGVLMTPVRLGLDDSADDEHGAVDADATPRASCHRSSLADGDPPVAASSDSHSQLATAANTRSARSSAIGDDSAMLRTMVPLAPHPMLRPAPQGKSFVIPEDEIVEEEAKREIIPGNSGDSGDDAHRDLSLHIPIPLMKRESFASATSEYTYDDGSTITGDNVCPICLSGFKIGDLLVTSKYCSHVFHKDCILEWLGKSDNCPVCRVDMVTASEMNKAATTLVGKTRMVRAVASLQANSTHSRARTSTSPQRSANAVSPFEGTVRRRAHSATYS